MPAPLKSYIERILNVLAEIDDLGNDKKEIYKQLAGDGYDRTVVSQVVGHIRKKAAQPGKVAEQSALFDLYLTEYEGTGTRIAITHAARELPDYDQVTGEVYPSEAAMLPQTGAIETLVANSEPLVFDPADAPSGAATRKDAGTAAPNPITDLTQPNPICRDPSDCGVYASWHHPCLACKRAASVRAAA